MIRGAKRKWGNDAMLRALKAFAAELGRTPTKDEMMCSRTCPVQALYIHRFGTWANALRLVGLRPNPMGYRVTGPVRVDPERAAAITAAKRAYWEGAA